MLNKNNELRAKALQLERNLEGARKHIVALQNQPIEVKSKYKTESEKNSNLELKLRKSKELFEFLNQSFKRQVKLNKQEQKAQVAQKMKSQKKTARQQS